MIYYKVFPSFIHGVTQVDSCCCTTLLLSNQIFPYLRILQSSRERGKKSIELEICLSVWDIVLVGPEFPLLKDFSEFLKIAKVPVITKDMWTQTLAFLCQVETDLSNFDDKGEGSCPARAFVMVAD